MVTSAYDRHATNYLRAVQQTPSLHNLHYQSSKSPAGDNGGIALRDNLNVRSFLALIVKIKGTIEGRVDYHLRPGSSIVLMAKPGVD